MKRCVLLAVTLASLTLVVQASDVEITSEPHHHLVLQNRYVRVFKVEVPPQQSTLMHRHKYDYAYVTIGDVELSNEVEGKPAATLKLRDGETRFSPGNFAHAIRVLSGTPFRNVTIEFLPNASPHKNWGEDRGLQVLEGGSKEILFDNNGVHASDVQLNPGGTLPKDTHFNKQLIVAVTVVELRARGGPSGKIHLQPGDIQWLNTPPTLVNIGSQPARFISFGF